METKSEFSIIKARVRATLFRASGMSSWCALVLIAFGWSHPVSADDCEDPAGKLVSVEGSVKVADHPVQMNDLICSGESIEVGAQSRAAVRLVTTQTVVRIDQNSTLLIKPSETRRSWLELLKGTIYLFSRQPESLHIDTPYFNAAIDGTEFVIDASDRLGTVTVIEGSVLTSNSLGEIRLEAGERASMDVGEAPRRSVVVDPLNAVQWALHYPIIGASETTNESVRSAAKLLTRGNVERAEALLANVPEDAAALALQAMIAVTRNRLADASRFAKQSVSADATSSVAYTALSYVQQANFEIENALESAKVAVRNDPKNADALARRAELELGMDDTSAALASADMAISVSPDNSRAYAILGFTRLIRLEITRAKAAFTEAVTHDPGDPLPRLGLGLATVRDGRLIEGREQLEVAAALDPSNALVRSYLGKAYAEEREAEDAAAQFALAKQLDPQDPTPWFYDALLAQALNRPVEAFRNIERARALNDNRLVYQSRLLVDKDDAAGSLSLARIYTDLGFEQPAINESTRSIETDPINFSAYRFLADSYAGRERHEAARRSVLFQAALLQPLTINPVQPYAQESDLLILTGTDPVDPSIREYSPLFDHEGAQIAGSLVAGSDDALGNNIVLSGLHDRVAYSIGQFHYETEGFRENADIDHDVYHGFVQGQILHNVLAQAALSYRDSEQGDLSLNIDPQNFNPGLSNKTESTSPHLGLRAELGPSSTLLFAVRAFDRLVRIEQPDLGFNLLVTREVNGQEAFLRYIFRGNGLSQSIGVDAHELDLQTMQDFEPCIIPSCPLDSGSQGSSYANYYYHADVETNRHLQWTLGLNYAAFDDDERLIDQQFIGPRFGVRWHPVPTREIRLSLSRGMNSREVTDLSLEPTSVAGFNQLYDDFTGTRYLNAGVAYDQQTDSMTHAGGEIVHRALDVPVKTQRISDDGQQSEQSVDLPQQETTVRSYLNRALDSGTSLGAELVYERFEREDSRNLDGDPLAPYPLLVETLYLPVNVNYSQSTGVFMQGEIALVHQFVEQIEGVAPPDATTPTIWESGVESEYFTNLNFSAGIKIPKWKMILRLDILNLLDEEFLFQGHSIRSAEPSSRRFSPGRTITGKVSFSFR